MESGVTYLDVSTIVSQHSGVTSMSACQPLCDADPQCSLATFKSDDQLCQLRSKDVYSKRRNKIDAAHDDMIYHRHCSKWKKDKDAISIKKYIYIYLFLLSVPGCSFSRPLWNNTEDLDEITNIDLGRFHSHFTLSIFIFIPLLLHLASCRQRCQEIEFCNATSFETSTSGSLGTCSLRKKLHFGEISGKYGVVQMPVCGKSVSYHFWQRKMPQILFFSFFRASVFSRL